MSHKRLAGVGMAAGALLAAAMILAPTARADLDDFGAPLDIESSPADIFNDEVFDLGHAANVAQFTFTTIAATTQHGLEGFVIDLQLGNFGGAVDFLDETAIADITTLFNGLGNELAVPVDMTLAPFVTIASLF